MTTGRKTGSWRLRGGVTLIPEARGGLVMQSDPLRVLRVNSRAFGLLLKCRKGLSLKDNFPEAGFAQNDMAGNIRGGPSNKPLPGDPQRSFLENLWKAGIVKWQPSTNGNMPRVTVVVPVYNRARRIGPCLESLCRLDYPPEKIEIIVVDDASTDETPAVVRQYAVKLIVLPNNRGQSAARNRGVRVARGDIIAFIDSDCIAEPLWLQQLAPYLQQSRFSLVGGFVDAVYRKSNFDRYETVCSPLNMGTQTVIGGGSRSVFYVPTCNMLVRKDAYLRVGGLDERLRVGEDVDLCWRLMAAGCEMIYVPRGKVRHKHRNRLWQSLKRRYDYGSSEAVLYDRFRHAAKRLPWQPVGAMAGLAGALALVLPSALALMSMVLILLIEALHKQRRLHARFNVRLAYINVLGAVTRSHLQLFYYLTHYLVRYYLTALLAFALVMPQTAPALLVLILIPALVTFIQKKPSLGLPLFLFFFWIEQVFYQTGAFCGCLQKSSFRLYRVRFERTGFLSPKNRCSYHPGMPFGAKQPRTVYKGGKPL